MILIADSGSTKTDWVLQNNKVSSRFKTIGYNPYFIDADRIFQSLSEQLMPQLVGVQVEKVFFYGAGCMEPGRIRIVVDALSRCFPKSEINVSHDMLAAARALLGNKPGFAAILGTGSNTCMYDGKNVIRNIDSLGYLLGDEGSGSYIGKKIVKEYMRGFMPKDLAEKFHRQFGLTNADVFDHLYNKPLPNRFLAGFCMFADVHKDNDYIKYFVKEAFNDFFNNLVTRYEGYNRHSFNCIGSVAYVFRDILGDVARSHGMEVGRIVNSPIDDLVKYHVEHGG